MGKKRRAVEQRKTLETRIDSSLLEGYQGRRILFEVNDIPILATLGRIGTQFIEVTRISIVNSSLTPPIIDGWHANPSGLVSSHKHLDVFGLDQSIFVS